MLLLINTIERDWVEQNFLKQLRGEQATLKVLCTIEPEVFLNLCK